MALADLTFKLYDDVNLTIESSTTLQLTCESDFSEGAQDFLYYFGSVASGQQLQTATNPGTDNIVITPTYILPEWEAATAYSLGDSVIPTSPNGYRYEVTTAGTSHATTEPTWGTTLYGTTTDNTVTWTLVAQDSPTTEIILADTLGDLDTNTPGAPLTLGTTLDSGIAGASLIYVRVTNTISTVSDSLGTPELGLNINDVQETTA